MPVNFARSEPVFDYSKRNHKEEAKKEVQELNYVKKNDYKEGSNFTQSAPIFNIYPEPV